MYLQLSSCGYVTYIIQICHNIHVDLMSSSYVFVTSVIQSFNDIPVHLLQPLCVFVTSVTHICSHVHMDNEEMQMNMIQICHNIIVVLSKAAHEYKLVYLLIWIFAQNLCRGLP